LMYKPVHDMAAYEARPARNENTGKLGHAFNTPFAFPFFLARRI
jgi:hypothetical protein